jgi:hypothetical protein
VRCSVMNGNNGNTVIAAHVDKQVCDDERTVHGEDMDVARPQKGERPGAPPPVGKSFQAHPVRQPVFVRRDAGISSKSISIRTACKQLQLHGGIQQVRCSVMNGYGNRRTC